MGFFQLKQKTSKLANTYQSVSIQRCLNIDMSEMEMSELQANLA